MKYSNVPIIIYLVVLLIYFVTAIMQWLNEASLQENNAFALAAGILLFLTSVSVNMEYYSLYPIAKVLSLILLGLNIGYSYQCDEITSYSGWYLGTGLLFLVGVSCLDYLLEIPLKNGEKTFLNSNDLPSQYYVWNIILAILVAISQLIYMIEFMSESEYLKCTNLVWIVALFVFLWVLMFYALFNISSILQERRKYSLPAWNVVAIVVVIMSVITTHWTIIVSSVLVYIILVLDHWPLLNYKSEEMNSVGPYNPNSDRYQLREMRFNF